MSPAPERRDVMNGSVERYEDMSPDGRLRMTRQPDGDVILGIIPPINSGRPMVSLEFCSVGAGGGQSPNTLRALRDLMQAIKEDNEQYPQRRP